MDPNVPLGREGVFVKNEGPEGWNMVLYFCIHYGTGYIDLGNIVLGLGQCLSGSAAHLYLKLEGVSPARELLILLE